LESRPETHGPRRGGRAKRKKGGVEGGNGSGRKPGRGRRGGNRARGKARGEGKEGGKLDQTRWRCLGTIGDGSGHGAEREREEVKK